jgi:ribonuclease J
MILPHNVPDGDKVKQGVKFKKQTPLSSITEFSIIPDIPITHPDEFLISTLGGVGRIGMNWTLYGHAGRYILVDAGVAFANEEQKQQGIDAFVPHPSLIESIKDKLEALVITHAHEDHIGGIDRLWPSIFNCPIHVTPFAKAVLSHRLEEIGTLNQVIFKTFYPGDHFVAGPFKIRTIPMTHSVPEGVALALTCKAGTVVHTGDFKLDPEPLLGNPTNLITLQAIGEQGVLAMVADSTNAHKDLPITSEAQVREAFLKIFIACKGTIVVSCFGSNIARIASVAVAAEASGRQFAIAGRSMRNNEAIAHTLGMLDNLQRPLAEPSHLEGLDAREKALVCTGTQGEERAALARLSRGARNLPKLGYGDTVVLSSRVIPGNEQALETVVSKLRERGVNVLNNDTQIEGYPFHVSGHAGKKELETIHRAIKPRFFIPVHGHEIHMQAHAQIGISEGAEEVYIGCEGSVMSLSTKGIQILGCLPSKLLPLSSDKYGNRIAVCKQNLDKIIPTSHT